jgi:hypothetical protein
MANKTLPEAAKMASTTRNKIFTLSGMVRYYEMLPVYRSVFDVSDGKPPGRGVRAQQKGSCWKKQVSRTEDGNHTVTSTKLTTEEGSSLIRMTDHNNRHTNGKHTTRENEQTNEEKKAQKKE